MVLKAKTLYDCTADNDTELSFKKDDIIVDVTQTNEEGWLEGRKEGSNIKGLFPSNYVELIEEKKIPPKIPRKIGSSSNNNIEAIDKPSLFEMGSSGSIKDSESDIGISIGKPRKLSKNTLAAFESKNNETLPIKPSINPRSKLSLSLIDNSSNVIKQTNNDLISKNIVTSPANTLPKSSTSVNSIKLLMENEKNEYSFVPPKKQLKKQESKHHDDDDDDLILLPSMIKKSQPFLPTSKPSIVPPPIASKPLILNKSKANLFINNIDNDSNNNSPISSYSRPPLPPRNPSSTPSISSASSNSNDSSAPPPTPPRPSSSTNSSTTSLSKSIIENHTGNLEKTKMTVQDQSVKVAHQGISNTFSQLKGELEKSPYGNKKIPGKDRFFKHAENLAKKEADVQIKNKIDNTANQQRDLFHDTLKNENGLISNLEKNFTATTKSSQSPPPLPSRKNIGLSTDSEVKIPRRPSQHSNSFSESNLTKGIPSDAKKRYEIVFDLNKDDDDLINAAVVKEIYTKSRLDKKALYKIWELLDSDENGNLNRKEFCIGMFLIDKRLQGYPIPDKLPKELLT